MFWNTLKLDKIGNHCKLPPGPLPISYLLISSLSLCNGFVKVISRGNLSGQTFIHLRSGVEEHIYSFHSNNCVCVFVLHVHNVVCVCVCVCVWGRGGDLC